MNVEDLYESLQAEVQRRSYFEGFEVLEQTGSLLKARLLISPNLFVQVYHNDRFNTTNFALLHNGRRLYARDQLAGQWHRHTTENPSEHDKSPEGKREVTLMEFLNEVESVLAELDLP